MLWVVPLPAWCTSPASACTISPPTSGHNAKLERLPSQCARERRLRAEMKVAAASAIATAGAGPSRLIASTCATKPAERF